MSTLDIFVIRVAPIAGVVVSTLLHLGPMHAVLKARRTGKLSGVDPLLFALSTPQATIWCVYGCLINNAYYLLGCIGGVLLGTFYLMSVMQLVESKSMARKMEVVLLSQLVLTACIAITSMFDKAIATQAAGMDCLITSLILSGQPLANVRTIIITRDASMINKGFLCMQILSGCLWTIYSIFDFDVFVIIPSLASFVLGILQLSVIFLFHRRQPHQPEDVLSLEDNSLHTPLACSVDTCYQPPASYAGESAANLPTASCINLTLDKLSSPSPRLNAMRNVDAATSPGFFCSPPSPGLFCSPPMSESFQRSGDFNSELSLRSDIDTGNDVIPNDVVPIMILEPSDMLHLQSQHLLLEESHAATSSNTALA
eukprot:CAMPEP_0171585116 /NCGR_PEP_ID=MMETSP0961-20121227/11802_1 /TAXON_ID=87120 /ORGANISM="Aurantiochytrium limacinum, Strain ATCCMYA-1381" /LENGTH=369 /DNA_ID=CAMNT_0012142643 /DNA_START=245 /DNA_END=1354 /DNA_ORIENTATION=-